MAALASYEQISPSTAREMAETSGSALVGADVRDIVGRVPRDQNFRFLLLQCSHRGRQASELPARARTLVRSDDCFQFIPESLDILSDLVPAVATNA